ncbi:hypothetical protein VOLCADRAFT_98859 [Volvox carteri f. nagariensis]|uniref:Pherophorin domain-containing protein n=1 Tax=Volvox carteri f. nagariensis TaxID=3068 RepID=D8UGG7_VOLCA|nr:uncharacterized protein VOLCADRAFT_98859 [Volvox carteri f. nagariensis]EFJ41196.1 hypothetical protein VOLCADRAFT_98859 [Volvox carteri f. nagariensis]|eukprot:XP_002957764.1 hypothetical protein VOLCADRAFT_98859 [Volvox carteri f. nagariensis]
MPSCYLANAANDNPEQSLTNLIYTQPTPAASPKTSAGQITFLLNCSKAADIVTDYINNQLRIENLSKGGLVSGFGFDICIISTTAFTTTQLLRVCGTFLSAFQANKAKERLHNFVSPGDVPMSLLTRGYLTAKGASGGGPACGDAAHGYSFTTRGYVQEGRRSCLFDATSTQTCVIQEPPPPPPHPSLSMPPPSPSPTIPNQPPLRLPKPPLPPSPTAGPPLSVCEVCIKIEVMAPALEMVGFRLELDEERPPPPWPYPPPPAQATVCIRLMFISSLPPSTSETCGRSQVSSSTLMEALQLPCFRQQPKRRSKLEAGGWGLCHGQYSPARRPNSCRQCWNAVQSNVCCVPPPER